MFMVPLDGRMLPFLFSAIMSAVVTVKRQLSCHNSSVEICVCLNIYELIILYIYMYGIFMRFLNILKIKLRIAESCVHKLELGMYKIHVIYFIVRLKDKKEVSEVRLYKRCDHFVELCLNKKER